MVPRDTFILLAHHCALRLAPHRAATKRHHHQRIENGHCARISVHSHTNGKSSNMPPRPRVRRLPRMQLQPKSKARRCVDPWVRALEHYYAVLNAGSHTRDGSPTAAVPTARLHLWRPISTLLHDGQFDTLALGQRDHRTSALADDEDVPESGRKAVAACILQVHNVE